MCLLNSFLPNQLFNKSIFNFLVTLNHYRFCWVVSHCSNVYLRKMSREKKLGVSWSVDTVKYQSKRKKKENILKFSLDPGNSDCSFSDSKFDRMQSNSWGVPKKFIKLPEINFLTKVSRILFRIKAKVGNFYRIHDTNSFVKFHEKTKKILKNSKEHF